ncbi:MAG: sigma-70 family RNA polymerase sigma factor [Clostridia bacterium]|nr:sigma-70 family RNA polymerase sigma factor [Clostridia bacterium]MBR2327840.1 sigma-70 family RNA polymerase sigma factor [Clostridia bacterium]
MTYTDNVTLLAAIKGGDKRAEEELLTRNVGLVKSALKHYHISAAEYDDAYQIGCIGLIKAARAFDESKASAFSTYAVYVITGEIKRYIRDNTPIKMSRNLREIYMRVCRETNKLQAELGREPTLNELASRTGDLPDDIVMATEANNAVLSLDYSADDDSSPLADTVGSDPTENLNEKLALTLAIERLEPHDRKIIALRYFKNKTQCETAKILGITQVQVSRRERAILKELKADMEL